MGQSKLLKVSWVLYTVFLFVAMIPAVINIVHPLRFFVADSYESTVGESWSRFVTEQPKQAALYENFCRVAAAGGLSIVVLALFITLGAYRRGEKWAWIALLSGILSANAIPAIVCLTSGDMVGALFWVFWLCVGLVILLLPAKEMLGHKTSAAIRRLAGDSDQGQP